MQNQYVQGWRVAAGWPKTTSLARITQVCYPYRAV